MDNWIVDEPLLSPKRLYNAVRLFFWFVLQEPERWYPLGFYLKWYRRKEHRFKRLGY